MKIEAGHILSESVVNIKTIFSFNFQKRALELYANVLNNERKQFLKSALMQGFWVGGGLAINSLGVGTLFKLAYHLSNNKKITFLKLMRTFICYNKWC